MSAALTRALIAVAGLSDLGGTLLQIVSYHAHAAELTLAFEFALLPWQALHAFTWFGALIYSSGAPGRSFGQMMLGAYIGALLGDSISALLRAFIPRTSTFATVTFWNALALAFVDGAILLFLWLGVTTFPSRLSEGKKSGEDPWSRIVRRRALPWLWVLELLFAALLILTYAIGLNRSPEFSRVILLEAAHAFVWLLHRAITGGILRDDGMRDAPGWTWLGTLAAGALALTGASAGGLRLYYIFTDADSPATLIPTLPIVWGWIQFGLGAALFAVSGLQAFGLASIRRAEDDEGLEEVVVAKESKLF